MHGRLGGGHVKSDLFPLGTRAGLITGANGQFRPEDQITRQEMAVMLSRALALRGQQAQPGEAAVAAQLSAFADQDAIAGWARSAAAQAASLGLMTGRAERTYAPRAHATRAEAIVVLKRLLKSLGKI